MSLEQQIADLTAAVKENTAAHAKLAEVAAAAASTKPVEEKAPAKKTTAAKKTEESEDAAEEKTTTKKAPAKKTTAKKTEKPELAKSVTAAKLKTAAGGYLKGDDEEARDAAKTNFKAALDHLGATSLSGVDNNTDRAKLAGYIAYWQADLEVDFEEIDALIEGDGEGDGDEDDDLLG